MKELRIKKQLLISVLLLILLFCLSSCCKHQWNEATCTSPKTCALCGAQEGTTLPHVVDSWETVSESTCSINGKAVGYCKLCGEQQTKQLSLKAHTLGEWFTSSEPTDTRNGEQQQKCTVCGAVVNRRSISLSAAEKEEYYKNSCEWITFDELARYPEKYKNKRVAVQGEVVQASYPSSSNYYCTFRVDITKGAYYYDDTVYVNYDGYGKSPRILEGDIVVIYGTSDGLTSYESVLGATITLPKITAKYMYQK